MRRSTTGVIAAMLIIGGCGGGADGGAAAGGSIAAGSVAVSWTPNREAAVNAPGGGYRVYYGAQPDFQLASAPSVEVPYEEGPRAPTRVRLALGPGEHFVRVVAYSALAPEGGPASAPLRVMVP